MERGFLRVVPTADKEKFLVEHNCNGNINFAATDTVDEKTARLIEFAILEGKRRRSREISGLLKGE